MEEDRIIIKAFNGDISNPNVNNVSVTKLFRSQINPTGLIIKHWRFDSDVNYKSFILPVDGAICLCKISTLFGNN